MAIDLLVDENDAVLQVDAVLTERHELTSRVTQFPVENGGNISDHILNEPRRVTIDGFVSDAPLSSVPLPGAGIVQALAALQTTLLPSAAAFDFLESLRDDRMVVTLITGLKRYTNMVLERLNIPRDASTGKTLRFSADFVQVTRVTEQVTEIPASQLHAGKATEQGASELDAGKQVPEPVPPSETQSLLKGAIKDAQAFGEDVMKLFSGELLQPLEPTPP